MADIKKVSWNASQGIIMEIANRRSLANTHFINNNIKGAMNTLIAIKQSVIQSFDPEERKALAKIETKFVTISPAITKSFSGSFNNNDRKVYSMANSLCKKIYSKYNDCLMDLLEKYAYLIGEQSDESVMQF